MIISRFDDAPHYHTPEGIMMPLFVSDALKVVFLKIPAGLKVHPHSHPSPGNFLLLKGSVILHGKDPALLKEGDFVHIPGGYSIGLESRTDAEALLISSPSGFHSIDEFCKKLEKFQK